MGLQRKYRTVELDEHLKNLASYTVQILELLFDAEFHEEGVVVHILLLLLIRILLPSRDAVDGRTSLPSLRFIAASLNQQSASP